LTVGCGSNGTITGTVTYRGTPITTGTIVFAPESGATPVTAPITDGKYTAEKVPAGPAKVGITSIFTPGMQVNPMQRAMQGGMPPTKGAELPEQAKKLLEGASQAKEKKGVPIPDMYASPTTSGLSYTVKSGKQTQDFPLDNNK
jgi:hypothetical protein